MALSTATLADRLTRRPRSPGARSRDAWRCYGLHGSIHLLIFAAVFNAASWLAAWRGAQVRLYLPQELAIPFQPTWIWVYASMALVIAVPPLFLGEAKLVRLGLQCLAALLVAAAFFILFPAELGHVRTMPVDFPYDYIFSWLFETDRPNNLVPSLHVAISTLCIAAFAEVSSSRTLRIALLGWLAAIVISTILVHQHHLFDAATGCVLAWIVRRALPFPTEGPGTGSAKWPARLPERDIVKD